MARWYCCFCNNRTASQLIALVEIVFFILALTGSIFTVISSPLASTLGFISAGLCLLGSVCLFVGARRGNHTLVMIWIIIALVGLILFAINVYNYSTYNGKDGHNFQWIGYIIGILLRVWFILVAIGAREEIRGDGPTGYVV